MALFAGVVNSHAQADFIYTNTAAIGYWTTGSSWVTNGGNSGEYPGDLLDLSGAGPIDGAYFTNAGTFYVKFTNSVECGSNFFANASGTVSQVTLDLGTFKFQLDDSSKPLVIGDKFGSTTTVYVASSTQAQGGMIAHSTVTIGKNGVGTLFITNGYVATSVGSSAAVSLGTGNGGHGHLVVSGPNTFLSIFRQFSVGNYTNPTAGACSVEISDSASVTVGSSFRMGCSSSGGSSSNTFLVDSNAEVSFAAGSGVVGHRGGPTFGSYDNVMTVQGGASALFNNHSFGVGWSDDDDGPGTGNVLNVIGSGAVTNVSVLNLRHGNFINLYGGAVGGNYTNGANGSILVEGVFQGYGSVLGSLSITTNGVLIVSNTVAPLSIQRDFLMTTNSATLQMALGTSFNTVPVGRDIELSGTLNLINGGGFTTTTYPLFTYARNIIYSNIVSIVGTTTNFATTPFITIGTTPDNTKTYTIDTNTAGQINLIVSGVATLPFVITSITRSGANVTINWNTKGNVGQTNFLQASPGTVNGSYPGTFVDIATNVIAGTTATFTDVGGVSGPNKYYRVRSPQ